MDLLHIEALQTQLSDLEAVSKESLGVKMVYACARCYQLVGADTNVDHNDTDHYAQVWPIDQVVVKLRGVLRAHLETMI